jgi:cytosine/adenosine deaminase-related metal-dependent hydrolase
MHHPLPSWAQAVSTSGGARAWGLALMGLALFATFAAGCRERQLLPRRFYGGDAGGEAAELAPGTPPSGSDGASETPAEPAGSRPPRVTCTGAAAPETCRIEGDARHGLRLYGTLLEPSAERVGGMLDVDPDGTIRCTGCDCGDAGGALVIHCPDLVISPGLLNLHDHLTYSGTPPLAHPGERYEHRNDWRLGEHGHAALPFEGGASAARVVAHELRMVMSGVTSIVGAGGRHGLLRNLDAPSQTEGLLVGRISAETFPLDDARGDVDSAECRFGKRPDGAADSARGRAYVPHLGEGTNQRAADELRCALGELGLVGETSAVVHAMALSRAAAEELSRVGASVVWSPRSNLDLYGSTAPVALLASLGVRVSLGTDWLASGSMNLGRELFCANAYDREVLGGYFGSYQLWRMVTENAAWALGLEGRLGALVPGAPGDLAVFRATQRDGFASVVEATATDVVLVLRGGAPLYGDRELVSAFDTSEPCEELEVCGAARRACLSETGLSLPELAADAVYPLFACEPPRDEPRCQALRARECPVGEDSCAAPSPPPAWDESDADADGVPDVRDICPRRADPQQQDADGDGHGDACDACPLPDYGLSPCPQPIAALRSPASRLPPKTAVLLQGVRVTALRNAGSRGFYVEDGDHAPYSGLFVYTGGTTPKVAVGDVVDLQGYFDAYQGTDELVDAVVLARSQGQPYAPLRVEASELADGAPEPEAFASLYVRIENAEVALQNPDLPADYDEIGLVGGLRLDDLIAPELDNTFPPGTLFAAVRGIPGISFEHHKLFPIRAEDLVAP